MIKAKPLEEISEYLEPGTELLNGQYTIQKFLNVGGFGITYLAKDSLDRNVVIKECYPGALCRREKSTVGVRSRAHENQFAKSIKLFLREAQNLAQLKHPNIVGVHQVFQDNQTAYMALDYIDGRELLDFINDKKAKKSPEFIISLTDKILHAIKYMHENNILHRDISPDNILISSAGEPVLIDFGAARVEAVNTNRVLSTLSIVKDGYSPQEFYLAGSQQNESSDLYAFGASIYHYISGELPPNSQLRLAARAEGKSDPYKPLVGGFTGYSRDFLEAIDKSLNLIPKERFQSAREWLDVIDPNTKTSVGSIGDLRSIISDEQPDTPMVNKKIMAGIGAGACVIALGAFFALNTGGGDEANVAPVLSVNTSSVIEDPSAEVTRLIAEKAAAEEAARVANEKAAAEEAARVAVEAAAAEEAARVAAETEEAERLAAADQAARLAAEEAAAAEVAKIETEKRQQLASDFQITTDQWSFDFPFDWKYRSFGNKRFVAVTKTFENGSDTALLERGDTIYKLNDTRIVREDTVMSVFNQLGNTGTNGQETVKVQFKKKGSNGFEEKIIQLHSKRSIALSNGISIQIEQENNAWVTIVNNSPFSKENTFLTGDIILAESAIGDPLDNPEKLYKLLSDIGNGSYASLSFSILRNDQKIDVNF